MKVMENSNSMFEDYESLEKEKVDYSNEIRKIDNPFILKVK